MRNLNSYMVRPRLALSCENDTLDTPPASAALNTSAPGARFYCMQAACACLKERVLSATW